MFRLFSWMIWLGCVSMYLILSCLLILAVRDGVGRDIFVVFNWAGAGILGWLPAIIHLRKYPESDSCRRKKWLFFYFTAPVILFGMGFTIACITDGILIVLAQQEADFVLWMLPVVAAFGAVFYVVFMILATFSYLGVGWFLKWCLIPSASAKK